MINLVKSSFITDGQIRRFLEIDELLNEADKSEARQLLFVKKRAQALGIGLVGFCFDPIAARYVNKFGKVGELFYVITPVLDISECHTVTPYTSILEDRAFLTLQVASTADVSSIISANGPVPKNLLTLDIPWHNYTAAHIAKSVGWVSIEEGFEEMYRDDIQVIFRDLVNYDKLLNLSDYLYQSTYYERNFE